MNAQRPVHILGKTFAVLLLGVISWCVYRQYRAAGRRGTDPKLVQLTKRIRPLFDGRVRHAPPLQMLNDGNVLDRVEIHRGEQSYTINKKRVYMCMTDEEDEYYSDNMLIYVLLHEIAHVLSTSIGHTDEFNAIFAALLDKAAAMDIYDPALPINRDYCLAEDDKTDATR